MSTQEPITPASIMAMSTAYWESQTLLTANRIGLFAALAAKPLSLEDVCSELGTAPRATRLLLNTCAALGLLTKVDEHHYANSPQSAAFLQPGAPGFLGNAIRYADNLYATWGQLEQALRTDEAQMPTSTYTGDDPQVTRDFVYAMHDRALGIARVLVELVDLSNTKHLLDVGGGPGTYSALFAQRYPQLHSRVFDLPGVVAHAQDIVATFGVSDRVSASAGDYTSGDFPSGNDAVMISGVFHRESEAGCRELITKAKAALDAGGQFIVSDVFADAGGASPPFAALFGLNMLLTAVDGGVHADADVANWMLDAGFSNPQVTVFPAPLPHRVVVATA
jgi:hypothetical protein